jgi:hypothetical protein
VTWRYGASCGCDSIGRGPLRSMIGRYPTLAQGRAGVGSAASNGVVSPRYSRCAWGDWPVRPNRPFVPGHEGVGVVERLGYGVTSRSVGDGVAIGWLGYACGQCRRCIGGWESMGRAATRASALGQPHYLESGGLVDVSNCGGSHWIQRHDRP